MLFEKSAKEARNMCDDSRINGWLTGAGASVAGAIAFITGAAIANNSFWGAGGAPALMVAAGLLTVAAGVTLWQVFTALQDFFNCEGNVNSAITFGCKDAFANVSTNLIALGTTLGIQATACFAAAGVAWIPWAGAVPMYVILAALVVQAVLIVSLSVLYARFRDCVNSHNPH